MTAIDRSPARLKRLAENLERLSLEAELLCADVEQWTPEQPFDAVLLDAPCSATGTIRRHPDVPWLKREVDIASLAAMQRRLIGRAVAAAKPGGTIVYCTCSLEPEEGEGVISGLLERQAGVRRLPITASDVSGQSEFITKDGDLRTLPYHLPDADLRFGGLDGFYAARLETPAKPYEFARGFGRSISVRYGTAGCLRPIPPRGGEGRARPWRGRRVDAARCNGK